MSTDDVGPAPVTNERFESRNVKPDPEKALSLWENEGGAIVARPPAYTDRRDRAFDES